MPFGVKSNITVSVVAIHSGDAELGKAVLPHPVLLHAQRLQLPGSPILGLAWLRMQEVVQGIKKTASSLVQKGQNTIQIVVIRLRYLVMSKKDFCKTLGCQMTVYDSDKLVDLLNAMPPG